VKHDVYEKLKAATVRENIKNQNILIWQSGLGNISNTNVCSFQEKFMVKINAYLKNKPVPRYVSMQ